MHESSTWIGLFHGKPWRVRHAQAYLSVTRRGMVAGGEKRFASHFDVTATSSVAISRTLFPRSQRSVTPQPMWCRSLCSTDIPSSDTAYTGRQESSELFSSEHASPSEAATNARTGPEMARDWEYWLCQTRSEGSRSSRSRIRPGSPSTSGTCAPASPSLMTK